MEYEYKARSYGEAGTSSGGRKAKGKNPRRSTFNGVVTLTAGEYTRAQQCMGNPGEPTPSAQQGAALLRKLYK